MEQSEISAHQLRVLQVVRDARGWIAREIAKGAKVAPRTGQRAHALAFVRAGIFDKAKVHPGHRYRLSPAARKRNHAYLDRLTAAESVFG